MNAICFTLLTSRGESDVILFFYFYFTSTLLFSSTLLFYFTSDSFTINTNFSRARTTSVRRAQSACRGATSHIAAFEVTSGMSFSDDLTHFFRLLFDTNFLVKHIPNSNSQFFHTCGPDNKVFSLLIRWLVTFVRWLSSRFFFSKKRH